MKQRRTSVFDDAILACGILVFLCVGLLFCGAVLAAVGGLVHFAITLTFALIGIVT